MIAALILVMSVVALIQFAISQWKSVWIVASEQPLSSCLEAATGIAANAIAAGDFDRLCQASEQLPASPMERNSWLREVRIYYRTLSVLSGSLEMVIPALAAWARKESLACARYAAVVLDQRLNSRLAYASAPHNS